MLSEDAQDLVSQQTRIAAYVFFRIDLPTASFSFQFVDYLEDVLGDEISEYEVDRRAVRCVVKRGCRCR